MKQIVCKKWLHLTQKKPKIFNVALFLVQPKNQSFNYKEKIPDISLEKDFCICFSNYISVNVDFKMRNCI